MNYLMVFQGYRLCRGLISAGKIIAASEICKSLWITSSATFVNALSLCKNKSPRLAGALQLLFLLLEARYAEMRVGGKPKEGIITGYA
jgi:hypothetical protein